jgi:hypothetical protein
MPSGSVGGFASAMLYGRPGAARYCVGCCVMWMEGWWGREFYATLLVRYAARVVPRTRVEPTLDIRVTSRVLRGLVIEQGGLVMGALGGRSERRILRG